MRNHGIIKKNYKEPWIYEMQELGYNYRITDFQCALGISQLSRLKSIVMKRSYLVKKYNEKIGKISKYIKTPENFPKTDKIGWHLYSPRINFQKLGVSRATFMDRLREKGVASQVHYVPINKQPYYRKRYGNIKLAGAERYYKQTLSLPLHTNMEDKDINKVLRALKFAANT